MDRKLTNVKPTRTYESPRRRDQAARTRAAILAAARDLFLRDGLAPTTIAAIAEAATVSVDTIYKAFGGKPGLLRELCHEALAGEGPVHAATRSDALQRSHASAEGVVRGFGRLSAEVGPRVAPILLLIRDGAGGSAEVAALRAELDDQRLQRMTQNALTLGSRGFLRKGV